jgi:hypothetical protein
VKYPGPGRFVLRVTEVVGRGGNPVRIRVDGQPALEADLVCEEGRGEKWEVRQPGPGGNIAVWYNRDLAVDLTAGPHVIEVENLGRDRLAANYRFEGLATREKTPDVRVAGLRHRDGAHVWAQNMTWTPGTLIGETVGVPSRKVEIRLGGLRNGPVTVDRWDPMTGALVQSGRGQVVGGALTLAVAELCSDAAWKIRYR